MQFTFKIFGKSWLVELATVTKRKVANYVENCEMFMSHFKTQVKLNVLPLGSYDVLIGMDWMEKQKVILNFFEKTFTYLSDKGERITVKGIPRKVSVRQISSLRMNLKVLNFYKILGHYTINLHSNLGTQGQSHKRLITIRHENGVVVLQTE